MSYKSSQLSPVSTGDANLRIAILGPWNSEPLSIRDTELSRSWLVYDSELDVPHRIDGNVLLGIALVIGISASFWAGVGFTIAQFWK